MTGWQTEVLRPKSGMILTIDSDVVTLDSPYFNEGDIVKIAESGAAAIIHDIEKTQAGWRARFSTGIYRHIDYYDRIHLDHDCRKNDCEWIEEDGSKWLSHDYSNDYEMLALPYYVVRFTKAGMTAINVGPTYREGSKLCESE